MVGLNVSYILLTVSLFHCAYGVGGVTEKLAGVVGRHAGRKLFKFQIETHARFKRRKF